MKPSAVIWERYFMDAMPAYVNMRFIAWDEELGGYICEEHVQTAFLFQCLIAYA